MTNLSDQDKRDLLDALDMRELPAEEQEKLLLEFGDLVFRGSVLRMVERMNEETKADFNKLLDDEPTEEQLISFLSERVPGADAAVEETLADLRSDILSVTGT